MGRPFEIANSPRAAEETESSSGEEQSGDEGLEWVASGQADDDEWEDPSGGVLSQVFDAAEAGDAAALAELLQGLQVSIDTRGADSDTAIHLAALYGHADCVRVLMDRGARADVADADGALPLHDAAAGGYTEIVEMLLDAAPGTVDRGDAEGDTPLHNAARGGHVATLRALLARGADTTLQNDEFKTAAQLTERGSEARRVLEEAARQAAEAGQPQGAAPLAEVA